MTRRTQSYLILVVSIYFLAFCGQARGDDANPLEELEDLSLEDLMNITVTSVSKREQNLLDAAAAIYVLTEEDLRLSGLNSIPDQLRFVPGMNVGGVNSNQWAVSSRGFNFLYANKLLVLMDGRAVYNPFWAGVIWDLQRPMLEDVGRIEIIRGPGATIWGANAVNGVINIVTQSAKETQGGLLYGGGGSVYEKLGGIRYGGQLNETTYYRAFASYQEKSDYPISDGSSARDDWESWHGGFRLDHYPDSDTHLTWQADLTSNQLFRGKSDGYNVNTIGRFTKNWSNNSSAEVQIYYDRTFRDDKDLAKLGVDTLDLDAFHTFELGDHQNVIWGGGYRYIKTEVEKLFIPGGLRNGKQNQELFSAFVQDEIQLIPNTLSLTAGIKAEYHESVGLEYQPSVRAIYKPSKGQIVWASVSRAVRTPSLVESVDMVNVVFEEPFLGPDNRPYLPTLMSNSGIESEILWAYEAGYRVNPFESAVLDVSVFWNRYSNLISVSENLGLIPGTPFGTALFQFDNISDGETYGAEFVLNTDISREWRVQASYSYFGISVGREDLSTGNSIEDSPEHQAYVRSIHQLNDRTDVNIQFRYVDAIRGVSSYITADARLSFQLNEDITWSLVGLNLLEEKHQEQVDILGARTAEIPRSVYGKISWSF